MMNKWLMFISKQWLGLTVVTLTAITALSLWPASALPSVPGSDKTHHFISYALLMFPVALAKPKHWYFIAIFFIVYSGMIEIIQPYVNRYGEWLDLLANSIGVMLAILLAQLLHITRRFKP